MTDLKTFRESLNFCALFTKTRIIYRVEQKLFNTMN